MTIAEEKKLEVTGVCPWCAHANVFVREGHFDRLFAQDGARGLREHLRKFWGQEEKLIEGKIQVRARRAGFEQLAREARRPAEMVVAKDDNERRSL